MGWDLYSEQRKRCLWVLLVATLLAVAWLIGTNPLFAPSENEMERIVQEVHDQGTVPTLP